jgi:hypothetical protein
MFMRISSLALALLLAGCGGGSAVPDKAEVEGGEEIACALAGAPDAKPACAVERSAGADGLVLTIHHPDGGFRRLLVTTDGRGVVAADGAESAIVKPLEKGLIEVTVGADRYQLPATVK